MNKKKIAACIMALTMTIAGAGTVPEIFESVMPNSITTVEAAAVKSADGNYQYLVLSQEDKTIRLNSIYNVSANITIPSTIDGYTVTTIGNGGTGIVSNLYGPATVQSITIPDTVTTVNAYAFNNMTNLSNVSIPSSVNEIYSDSFYNSGILNNNSSDILYVGNWIIKANTGISSASIKSGTVGIAARAFKSCKGISSITLPASVKTICTRAFDSCTGLGSVTIQGDLEYVGDGAFYGCTSLKTADLSKVTVIADNLFASCTSLSNVTVSSALKKIGKQSFENTAISSITLPSTLRSVGYNAFNGTPLINNLSGNDKVYSGWLLQVSSPSGSYTIPSGVTGVGAVFSSQTSLTSVSVPSSVKYISDSAFENCSGIATVTFSEGLVGIGDKAFRKCVKLSSVKLPSTLQTLGEEAFAFCYTSANATPSGLKTVTLPDGIASIGDDCFTGDYLLGDITIRNANAVLGTRCVGFDDYSEKNKDFLLYGYNNSTAYSYAAKNGLKFEIIDGGSTHTHTYGDWTVTKQATCKEEGSQQRTCSGCGNVETQTIAKTAHTAGDWKVVTAATCKTAGRRAQYCTVCNTVLKTETIPVTNNHTYGAWTVTKQATCKEAGSQQRTCSVCGKVETQEIAKLTTHSYKAVQVVPPTTTTQGYTVYKCTVCGASYNGDYTNPTSKTTYSIKLNTASSGDSAKYANSAVSLTFKGSVTKTVNTSNKTFQVPDGLADGTYTLQLGAANFAERSYTVTVKGGNLTADPKAELNLYGDIDSDGKLTTTDLMLLKRSLINMVTFNDYQTRIADVDKSGKVQLNDVTLIKRHLINIKKLW